MAQVVGRGGAHTKYSLYDAAERVPLVVRWPGVSQSGTVSHAAVELVDLMPTWLEAAGLEVPAYLPGRSVRPLLLDVRSGHNLSGQVQPLAEVVQTLPSS